LRRLGRRGPRRIAALEAQRDENAIRVLVGATAMIRSQGAGGAGNAAGTTILTRPTLHRSQPGRS
jgi:hypothetical protein